MGYIELRLSFYKDNFDIDSIWFGFMTYQQL